jgi:hypothetical protein
MANGGEINIKVKVKVEVYLVDADGNERQL